MIERDWRRLPTLQSGTTTLEFALVVIVPVLFMFGAIEWGRLLWTRQVMMHTADMTARCYSINSPRCSGTNTPASYAVSLAAKDGITLTSSDVTTGALPACNSPTGGSVTYYTVSISYGFNSPVATLLPLPATLSVSSRYGC